MHIQSIKLPKGENRLTHPDQNQDFLKSNFTLKEEIYPLKLRLNLITLSVLEIYRKEPNPLGTLGKKLGYIPPWEYPRVKIMTYLIIKSAEMMLKL